MRPIALKVLLGIFMKLAVKNKWLLLTLLIWVIIFSIPPLRLCVKAMVNGSPWIHFTVFPRNWDSRFGPNSPELPIRVHAIKGSVDTFEWPRNFQALNKFDALLQKNPNLPWLIALRLQVTTIVFKTNRVGGELSDGRLPEHLKAGIPSPETNGEKVNFTPEQMQRTLALCRSGEKLEPQNAFFSWMRACFLLMNWQDQKAWQALDEAAHKTYWNNHYVEFNNLYAESSSKILNRPLLPIETLNLTSISQDPFTQTGKMREMCRIINWEAIKLKRQGKDAQALQIWVNFHHTLFLATQGDADFMDSLIDFGMLSIAQSGATYPKRNKLKTKLDEEQREANAPPTFDPKKDERDRQKRVNGFIAFAEEIRRPDLAHQIKVDAQQAFQLFQKGRNYRENNTAYPYTFDTQFIRLQFSGTLFYLSAVLLLSILSSLFIWLILVYCNSFLSLKSTFNQTNSPLSKRIIGSAKLCYGLWLLSCLCVLIYLFGSITTTTIETLPGITNGWLILPFSISFSSDNLISKSRHLSQCFNNTEMLLQFWRVFILLLPLLAASFYVLQKRLEWQAKAEGKDVWNIWTLLRKLSRLQRNAEFNRAFIGWLGRKIYLFFLLASWGILIYIAQYIPTNIIILPVAMGLLIFVLIWMFRAAKQTSAKNNLQLIQRILANWICIASVLILVLLATHTCISPPLQKWANNELHGEMHLLHHVDDTPP
jgi:hypothetical protein